MKRVLFISQSTLCHNLLKIITEQFPTKTELDCVNSIEESLALSKKSKPYHLMIFDWNCLMHQPNPEVCLPQLKGHPAFGQANWVLIYPHQGEFPKTLLEKKGFRAFYAKPFIADELAQMIHRWSK